jgi:transcription elongation factor GreA
MAIAYLSQGGYDKLKADVEYLKTVRRGEVARAIAEARDKGDLSENAEYHAAKEEQGLLEMKINELDMKLSSSRVLDETLLDNSKVTVFSNVTIKHVKMGKILTYKLVSETEADAKVGKISVTSPIGQGLLGKVVGEVALVKTPTGNVEFEVLDISIGD